MGPAAAARLLMQGTFGPTMATIAAAQAQSYAQWFSAQLAAPPSLYGPQALAAANNVDWSPAWFNTAVTGPDQLRQRVAFALSQILVVSGNGGPLWGHNRALASYYDILVRNAFGNYRTLLEQVTLAPAMGRFLSTWQNSAAKAPGTHADQNYAREIMQLFTVGLWQLNLDGTRQLDGSGNPIPTYSQEAVAQLAKVFTGWGSKPVTHSGDAAYQYDDDETDPMVAYPDFHDTTSKTLIGNVTISGGGSAPADLTAALNILFDHPNVGPFIGRQLIERLVTSNPSPQYVQRVAQAFNNDGSGVRGNLRAVVEAVLTDPEALAPTGNTYGKLREPLLRLTHLWRAFDAYNATNQLNEYMVLLIGNAQFGQYPLQAPSVFNFYRPDYQPLGILATGDLIGPEYQITNEDTLVATANRLQIESYQYVDGSGTVHAGPDYNAVGALGSSAVLLHTAAWEHLAANPAALVDELNLVMMAGSMPTTMRSTLIAYATGIPASSPGSRVAETAELVVNSPQYAVQR